MKFVRARHLLLLLSGPFVIYAVLGGVLGRALARDSAYRYLSVFQDVVTLIMNNYVDAVEMDGVLEGGIRGPLCTNRRRGDGDLRAEVEPGWQRDCRRARDGSLRASASQSQCAGDADAENGRFIAHGPPPLSFFDACRSVRPCSW